LLPVFVIFVVGYKLWKKTKWVSLQDMDIWSGRRDIQEEEDRTVRRKRLGMLLFSETVAIVCVMVRLLSFVLGFLGLSVFFPAPVLAFVV
jgi:amino acid permease